MGLIDEVKELILSLDQVRDWPEMARVVRAGHRPAEGIPCWEYPILACEAVGGRAGQALPAVASTVCLLNSIHLIDDLIDDDPQGLFHKIGSGTVANLAVAFQAAAAEVLEGHQLAGDRLAAAQSSVARAGLGTAFGQNLDVTEPRGDLEENYWRAAEAKTPPLFGAAFFLGALFAGADEALAGEIERLAVPIGRMIQAGDDMTDALADPADPDWKTRWNNLVLLYATLAEHAERDRFLELAADVEAPGALHEAQEILVRSGAVSYGCYHVIEGYRASRKVLESISLPRPEALGSLLDQLILPARLLFDRFEIPFSFDP